MTLKITSDNIETSTLNTLGGGVKITTITYPGDDTAAATAGGQTITLTGTGFNSGAAVLINGSYAGVVTVVSSTSITFTAPANSGGTYPLYVINPDGGTAISVPGISYSGVPSWSTAAGSITTLYETSALSNTVTATGDATLSYSLYSGTLPPGSSLNTSTGLISGTSQGLGSSTTYTFTIRATDGQNQDTDRTFTITINPDVVTWSSPTDNSTVTGYEYAAISPVTLSATSAAGKSITYTANTLPTGVSISGDTISGTPTTVANTNTLLTANAASTFKTATRNINFVVNQDVVTWSSPADGTITNASKDLAISAFNMSATSAAGKSITYTANTLPTGLSISGSTIIGTPSVVANSGSLITATAADTGRTATRTFNWVVSIGGDAFWKYTTFLLNGEGAAATNNAQNNTILDSSASAIAITRNGDIAQGTFTPFSASSWSNYFPAAGVLTTPASAVHNLGTGDFTVELWYNQMGSVGYGGLFMLGQYNTGIHISLNNSTYTVYCGTSGSTVFNGVSGPVVNGEWNHVALTRSGTTLTLWHNGVSKGSVSNSAAVSPTAGITLGATGHNPGSERFNGYISNVRLVKGTCLYASTFTPPTAELTAITGTTILACQSNRFKDNSENNWTFTVSGTVSVSKYDPFPGVANYSPSTHGGSAYYSGSPWIGFSQPALTSVFTIESWLYFPAINSDKYLYVGSGATGGPLIRLDSTGGTMSIGRQGGMDFTVSTPYPIGQWFHFAYVRQGTGAGQTKVYYNGVLAATAQQTTTFSAGAVGLGSTESGGQAITGYISGWRLVPGTAVYTANFTPPTAPATAISGTGLLLNFTNAGIIDQSGSGNILSFGNAKITTAVQKYGSSSMAFDGTGDYFQVTPVNQQFAFNQADFTIEAWVYRTDTGVQRAIVDTRENGTGVLFFVSAENLLKLFDGSSVWLASTNTVPANQWVHVAVSRSTGTTRLFINGALEASSADSRNYAATGMVVGRQIGSTSADWLGYIDDLRVTKGYGRYITAFTPPAITYLTQ